MFLLNYLNHFYSYLFIYIFFRKPERRSLRIAHLPAPQDYQLPEESKIESNDSYDTDFKNQGKCLLYTSTTNFFFLTLKLFEFQMFFHHPTNLHTRPILTDSTQLHLPWLSR